MLANQSIFNKITIARPPISDIKDLSFIRFSEKNAGVFGFDAGILGGLHRVSQIQLIVISHHISHHLGWFSWGGLE